MTHPELPGADEIKGNLIALNALSGIPLSSIQGFRFPYLNYSASADHASISPKIHKLTSDIFFW